MLHTHVGGYNTCTHVVTHICSISVDEINRKLKKMNIYTHQAKWEFHTLVDRGQFSKSEKTTPDTPSLVLDTMLTMTHKWNKFCIYSYQIIPMYTFFTFSSVCFCFFFFLFLFFQIVSYVAQVLNSLCNSDWRFDQLQSLVPSCNYQKTGVPLLMAVSEAVSGARHREHLH